MSEILHEVATYIREALPQEKCGEKQYFGTPHAWVADMGIGVLIKETRCCVITDESVDDLRTIREYVRAFRASELADERRRQEVVMSALTHVGLGLNQAMARMQVLYSATELEMEIGLKLSSHE